MLAPVSPGFAEINKKGEENAITSKIPKSARSPINGERYFYALKGGVCMSELLFFIIGTMLGGCIGIVIMCLLQINRLHGKEDKE